MARARSRLQFANDGPTGHGGLMAKTKGMDCWIVEWASSEKENIERVYFEDMDGPVAYELWKQAHAEIKCFRMYKLVMVSDSGGMIYHALGFG